MTKNRRQAREQLQAAMSPAWLQGPRGLVSRSRRPARAPITVSPANNSAPVAGSGTAMVWKAQAELPPVSGAPAASRDMNPFHCTVMPWSDDQPIDCTTAP